MRHPEKISAVTGLMSYIVTPLYCGRKVLNHCKSLKKGGGSVISDLWAWSLSTCNIRFRNTRAGFTHLLTYSSEPNYDWRLFLVHVVLVIQFLHIWLISCNFSGGIAIVLVTVSNNIPRHTACVDGGWSFLVLTSRPSCWRRSKRKWYEWWILEGKAV